MHEHWHLDVVTDDGPSGFVRLAFVDARAWYWCYVVGRDVGLVAVRDHDVARPRRPDVLQIRADALWAELVCETADEHWGVALEAFGVRLDRPLDALVGEIGERLPVGLDLEWEVAPGGPPFGTVRGEVLLGRARHEVDGVGFLMHRVEPPWPDDWSGWCRLDDGRVVTVVGGTGGPDADGIVLPTELRLADGTTAGCEVEAVVPVPLSGTSERGPSLVRVLTGTTVQGVHGRGWVEMLQP